MQQNIQTEFLQVFDIVPLTFWSDEIEHGRVNSAIGEFSKVFKIFEKNKQIFEKLKTDDCVEDTMLDRDLTIPLPEGPNCEFVPYQKQFAYRKLSLCLNTKKVHFYSRRN